jgi:hypothetical protein
MNLLAGKLKINLFKIIFAESENERKRIWKEVYNTVTRYLMKVKENPKEERKNNTTKKKYPYNNRKNFQTKIRK